MESPYIVIASTFEDKRRPSDVGADAVSEFPPHGAAVNLSLRTKLADVRPGFKGNFISYLQNIANFLDRPDPDYPLFPGVVPSWDNTARRQNDGLCMPDSTPAAFELWLRELIHRASLKPDPEQRIIFVNAWNEWAERCHLEPDKWYGRAWLEACRNAPSIPGHYQPVFVERGTPTAALISAHLRDLPVADS